MELRNGDIFVFEAEEDFLSKCIAYLTKSDVSHAALLKDSKMVEMGAYGICEDSYHESKEGIRVDVMRLKPEKDADPVIRAAQYYIDSDVKYDYPQLILLGGLLLYWPLRPTKKYKQAVEIILKSACLALDKLLNKLIHKGKKVMMCSQLVYECYLEGGEDYIIKIKNGVLQNQKQEVSLIELISKTDLEKQELIFPTIIDPSEIEKAAEDLYHVFTKEDQQVEIDKITENGLQELCGYAACFYNKIEELQQASETGRPMASLFVTPADLRYHAVNLEKIGELSIVRDR